jgi:hypothetical protein
MSSIASYGAWLGIAFLHYQSALFAGLNLSRLKMIASTGKRNRSADAAAAGEHANIVTERAIRQG